jgi:hypothetical protein
MADGSKKRVSELRVGDRVRGHTRTNTVLQVHAPFVKNTLYGINGRKPFVTGGHPFMTQKGWKAFDPQLTPVEGHNVQTTKIEVGDVLIKADGGLEIVESINSIETGTMTTYSPVVDGDNTYYADDFLVHNKRMC